MAKKAKKVALVGLLSMVAMLVAAACGHMMMGTGAEPPAASEFGFGPRGSAAGLYTATLESTEQIRVRRMQTMRVTISDAAGRKVEGASVTIDGGMPQHGHGLPTQPRVTRYLGDGVYEIEGVKFNMGGWWEFQVAVAAAAGLDTVTFNLDL